MQMKQLKNHCYKLTIMLMAVLWHTRFQTILKTNKNIWCFCVLNRVEFTRDDCEIDKFHSEYELHDEEND